MKPTTSKPKPPKSSKPKTRRRPPLSTEELLKLAATNRPPQSWFDEGVNPFEPKR